MSADSGPVVRGRGKAGAQWTLEATACVHPIAPHFDPILPVEACVPTRLLRGGAARHRHPL